MDIFRGLGRTSSPHVRIQRQACRCAGKDRCECVPSRASGQAAGRGASIHIDVHLTIFFGCLWSEFAFARLPTHKSRKTRALNRFFLESSTVLIVSIHEAVLWVMIVGR